MEQCTYVSEVRSEGDDHLVGMLKVGSRDSFGTLYHKYYQKVFHTCYSYTGNREDAFDLTQDIFLKVYTRIESFRGASSFSTWLFAVTRNHCISYAAKKNNQMHEDLQEACLTAFEESDAEEYENRLHRETMECELGTYLSLLPRNDQRMLELKYHQNYSIKELQKEFGLSASAIKMRLLRSRQRAELIAYEMRNQGFTSCKLAS